MAENVPLQGKIFLLHAVICWQQLALYLNVSRPCATCPKIQVFEPRIGLHGGGRSPPPCSRTFASTLVTLQIMWLDVDLVTLASISLSRVKKSGRIQY